SASGGPTEARGLRNPLDLALEPAAAAPEKKRRGRRPRGRDATGPEEDDGVGGYPRRSAPQRGHRILARRAPGRDEAGREPDQRERGRDRDERERVGRADAEHEALEEERGQERGHTADEDAEAGRRHPFADHEP